MKEAIQKTIGKLNWDAWEIAKENNQTVGEKKDFYITLEQLQKFSMNACPMDCHKDDRYGFVPEAGCPIHDN